MKLKFAAVLALLCPVLLLHAATAPMVVFIGDNYTVNWESAFAANPTWINKGTVNNSYPQNVDAQELAQNFQQDVVALHPAVVHILMGLGDAGIDSDSSYQFTNGNVLSGLQSMLDQAKAADIQVVLGIEPTCGFNGGFAHNGNAQQMINTIIGIFGAQNNLPVINYGDALCGTVGSTAGKITNPNSNVFGATNTAGVIYGASGAPGPLLQQDPSLGEIPTTLGYSMMTEMAEATLYTLNAKLVGGYLQNSEVVNGNEAGPSDNINVNTVGPAAVLQFIPYGDYNNGMTVPLVNTTIQGQNGKWASSNPLVMYVNQQGQAFAVNTGTAIITYTSPTGKKFNEWIMYVSEPVG